MHTELNRYEIEQIAWYFLENPFKSTANGTPPFAGMDLTRANLYGANLYGANLYGANLEDANLTRANLEDANLYGANLYGANLYGANLEDANLYGANLTRANLEDANLTRANLEDANLTNAMNVFTIYLPGMSSRNDALHGDIQQVDGEMVVMLSAGCFRGTLAQFEAKVRREKGDDALYLATLPLIAAWVEKQKQLQAQKSPDSQQ